MRKYSETLNFPKVTSLKRYLSLKGWEESGNSNNYSEFTSKDNVEIIIPKDNEIIGGKIEISNALDILSQLYNENVEDIILKIHAIRSDIIRSRLPDQLVSDDTIDLDTASEYVLSLKNLMISSAAAEVNKEGFVARSPKKATEYVRSCRFGHTFKGSFGFVIESPLKIDESAHLQTSFISEEKELPSPFERNVVTRLAHGLRTLNDAALKGSVDPLLEDYQYGFNANMLIDLISLHEASKLNAVRFDFLWSEEVSQKRELIVNPLKVDFLQIELAESAVRQFKRQPKEQWEHVVGFVTQLRSDIATKSESIFHDNREVVIQYKAKGNPPRNVHVKLSENNYLLAIQAHEEGQFVSLKGTLAKQGRYWYLSSPESFSIIK